MNWQDTGVPQMQQTAYCRPCSAFHDPADLRQTYYARDELACPDCYTPVAPEDQP
jgi:hypothetical protein